jgi:hypothetical protein
MGKYVVRLQPEEHDQLLALVNTGHAAAAKLLHARILLKADVSGEGRCWTDAEIAEALDTSAATVHRVRQACVESDLETALGRKPPTGWQYRKLDGAQEARLIAVACSAPPEGRTRWTLTECRPMPGRLTVHDTRCSHQAKVTLPVNSAWLRH